MKTLTLHVIVGDSRFATDLGKIIDACGPHLQAVDLPNGKTISLSDVDGARIKIEDIVKIAELAPLLKLADETLLSDERVIEALDLGVTPYNVLKRANIQTVGELAAAVQAASSLEDFLPTTTAPLAVESLRRELIENGILAR